MKPTQEIANALFRDKLRLARARAPADKLLAGPRLFDRSCRLMLAGIRQQFPGVGEQEARQILKDRLRLGRRLENRSGMRP